MRLAGRLARCAGYKSRRAFLNDITPEDWAEHVAQYNVEPWGPEVEARQRADLICAIYNVNDAECSPSDFLTAWGFGDDGWNSLTDAEMTTQTKNTLNAMFTV